MSSTRRNRPTKKYRTTGNGMSGHKEYKGWPLMESLPKGWKIDKTAGSPLHGYTFITNGKSVLYGQKRALVKITEKSQRKLPKATDSDRAKRALQKPVLSEHKEPIIDSNYRKTVNELAREKFKQRLLNDIRVDLMICEIEEFSKMDYINELKELINGIG